MLKKIAWLLQTLFFYAKSTYQIWRLKYSLKDDLIYTTSTNVLICVYPGNKKQSPHDFIVRYREQGKRERTPAHVHLIVEMYVKHAYNAELTLRLKEHILTVLQQIKPVDSFPPALQIFRFEHVEPFKALDNVGEFTAEFLLVVTELLAIQEKTNYPTGSLTEKLYSDFGEKDRFSVIQKAIWKG